MRNDSQQSLFGQNPQSSNITIEDGILDYFPVIFDETSAQRFLHRLINEVDWRQDSIRIAGNLIPIPRLQAWFGDAGTTYTYSGLKLAPLPWSHVLLEIKEVVETITNREFNSALLNYYRNGKDSVGWHSDDEKELGVDPVIASVSFGISRTFELKHKKKKRLVKTQILLENGSILVMGGKMQKYWRHQLPKDPNITAARVNLTFRSVITDHET